METVKLNILATSDIHGAVLPIRYADNEPVEAGLAKIAAKIREFRQSGQPCLVIDNGDLLQGTPLAYYHAKLNAQVPHPVIQCLNDTGYDAAVIGNHEFNYGLDLLRKAVKESAFPWLSANIVDSSTGEPAFGRPYVIKSFEGGLKAAVLGLTTSFIPHWEKAEHIAGLRFEDAVQTAKHWVKVLKEREKADVVIVSYHGGFERDLDSGEPTEPLTGENQAYALCREVPGIDVLLTGHQHRLIANQQIEGVTVIQPGSGGTHLGVVALTLIKNGEQWTVQDKSSRLQSMNGVAADPAVLRIIAEEEARTQAWLDQPIGRIEGDMSITDPMQVRLQDHPLIEFINKVQMDVSGADVSNTALFDNHSVGFGQQVTMRDIVSNYVYPNSLQVIRISGQDIKDALERSAAYFKTYDGEGPIEVNPAFLEPKPQHYNYDMWEGISYKLNISRPYGQRVEQLTYRGSPLDLRAQIDVVMNNYRAGGGGHYPMFQGKPVVKDIPVDMSELMAAYIMERGVIRAELNHNWRVIWDEKPEEGLASAQEDET